jgi:hypothetical protein
MVHIGTFLLEAMPANESQPIPAPQASIRQPIPPIQKVSGQTLREICRENSQAVFAEDELVTCTGSYLSARFLQGIATLNN